MKRLAAILILLLLPCSAFGTAYTSTQAGNWSAQATWGGSGPPTSGDSATVNHAVTVDVDTSVGTSGAASTIDVLVDATGGKTGAITVAAGKVFTVKGDLQLKDSVLTMSAGSTYKFDSSSASGTPKYRIAFGSTTGQTNSKLICNGTDWSGGQVTFTKQSGSGNGLITLNSNSSSCHGQIDASYTSFTSLGSSSTGFGNFAIYVNAPNSGQVIKFNHCRFEGINQINILGCHGAADLTFTYNEQTAASTESSAQSIWWNLSARTTGLRLVTNNIIWWPGERWVWQNSVGGWTFENNIVRSPQYYLTNAGGYMASCKNNLFYFRTTQSVGAEIGETSGTVQDNYVMGDYAAEIPMTTCSRYSYTGTVTYDGNIYETSWPNESTDVWQTPSPDGTVTYQHSREIVLPNSRGGSSGNFPAHGNSSVTARYEHCTAMTGNLSGSGTGNAFVYSGSGYNGHAGMYPAVRDNIVWSKTTTPTDAYIIYRSVLNTADVFTTSGCDYNAKFNLDNGTVYDAAGANGATKLGYHQPWLTDQAIGAHDLTLSGSDETTGGPKFVDSSRNFATFDTAYLGNSATAWANSTSYSVGDIVSASDSGFYGGATINYRCVTAHTSNSGNATNGKPGVASSYRTNWEFATAYRIRNAVLAGTTITDASLSLSSASYLKTLHAWVRAGFVPRESSLRNAGHDGVTIGAVEGQFASNKGWIYYYQQSRNALERAILAQASPTLSILTER